jgi:hypothetical protein
MRTSQLDGKVHGSNSGYLAQAATTIKQGCAAMLRHDVGRVWHRPAASLYACQVFGKEIYSM